MNLINDRPLIIKVIYFSFLFFIGKSGAFADQMPPQSGIIALANEPATIKTVSLEGKIIGRSAGTGQPIYLNDEIKTGPQSRLQILLKDQSVFNIGPNSVLIIDKFVYDPNKSELNVIIQRGAFKFVSGKISSSNPDAMKVSIPNATIAVRGTGVAGEVSPNGSSTVVLLHGVVGVTTTNQGVSSTATLSKSGWGVQVGAQGSLSSPSLVPIETLKGITQKVGSSNTVSSSLTTASSSNNPNQSNTQSNSGLSSAELANSVDASRYVSAAAAQSFKTSFINAVNAQTALNGNSNMLSASVLSDAISNNPEVSAGIVKAFGMPPGTIVPASTLSQFINSDFATYYALLVFPTIYSASDIINSRMGPLGNVSFSANNISMACQNTSCGTGATATINSQTVVLNYSTSVMTNSYNVSYANFNGATGSIVSSGSSNFSTLTAANAQNVQLPMGTTSGPGSATLNMIGQFGSLGSLTGKWSTLTTTIGQGSGVMRAGYQVKGQ